MSSLIDRTANELFQEAVRLLNIRAMILGDETGATTQEIVDGEISKRRRHVEHVPLADSAAVVEVPGKGKRRISAAGLRAMRKAQKERWAKWRKARK